MCVDRTSLPLRSGPGPPGQHGLYLIMDQRTHISRLTIFHVLAGETTNLGSQSHWLGQWFIRRRPVNQQNVGHGGKCPVDIEELTDRQSVAGVYINQPGQRLV